MTVLKLPKAASGVLRQTIRAKRSQGLLFTPTNTHLLVKFTFWGPTPKSKRFEDIYIFFFVSDRKMVAQSFALRHCNDNFHFVWFSIHIFLVRFSKSYCQRKPGYYSSSANSGWGGYQQNLLWSPRRPLRQVLAMLDSPLQHWIHLLCLIRIRYIWVGMNLGQNLIMPQFGGKGAEGPKTQNLFLFKLIDRKSIVV